MPSVIALKNGKTETVFDLNDLLCLIEQHMGDDARRLLLAFRLPHFAAPCRLQDDPAALQNIGNGRHIHLYHIALHKTEISSADAQHLQAVMDPCTHDGTQRRVHARRITAAGQYSDLLKLLRHILLLTPSIISYDHESRGCIRP